MENTKSGSRKTKLMFAAGCILIIVIFICGGCAKKHPAQPEVYYWFITETDASGGVITADPEDWQDSGVLSGVKLYPNPLPAGSDLTLDFTLASSVTSLNIDFYIAPDDRRLWFEYTGAFSAGANQLVLDAGSLDGLEAGKIYRVYISTGASEVWGDLRIK